MQDMKLAVKVRPFSSRSRILGFKDGVLEVAIAAKPKDGEANEELRRCLSRVFGVTYSNISIDSGRTSRTKVLTFHGLTTEEGARILDGLNEEEAKKEA